MLNIAIKAIISVRNYTLYCFNHAKEFSLKPDQSLVTKTDLYIEKKIREFLSIVTPNIPILGEEFGSNNKNYFETGWVIDPIDGTRTFLYGVPLFSTLLSYIENNEPVIGVISFPALNKIIYASLGEGCWIQYGNESPIKVELLVGSVYNINNAVVSFSGVHSTIFDSREGKKAYNIKNVIERAKDIVFINDSYQHMMVLFGRINAAVDTLMKPWDIAALIPCMKETGLAYANLHGIQKGILWGESLITASSQSLLEELINALNENIHPM
ncbi:inositol monophosphatase family protein [Pantoea sp. Nvir]|uniref:inositol monophosphatase family protein n=1 Tax=Pantoea sp. Nvir TaxID=2576760 RepID=UPI001359E4B6|nr:inositol monophosphatase family protein [Pantoea sp. Nvir]MXP67108.1 histidinol-phosphate aminotransferase [Pantoea sp. Nvir]CAJ0993616.1 3'(2'),5'-bisphosphate nucleotidase CysQ [Pantoea sp. Nvir]